MTTDRMLFYQLKCLVLNTKTEMDFDIWSGRYRLCYKKKGDSEPNSDISKFHTKTEMYDMIYAMNKLLEMRDPEPLEERELKYIEEHLHDEKIKTLRR